MLKRKWSWLYLNQTFHIKGHTFKKDDSSACKVYHKLLAIFQNTFQMTKFQSPRHVDFMVLLGHIVCWRKRRKNLALVCVSLDSRMWKVVDCSIFLLWFNGRLMNSWFVSISIGIHWPNYCLIVLMAISTVFQWMFNRVGQLAPSLWEVFAFLQMVSSLAAHFPAGNSGNCGTAQRS